jgi:predicted DNA-binding transcriptional regulator AlpA
MPELGVSPRAALKTDEAAAYCGSSSSTLEKLRVYGGGPAFVKLGRRVIYQQRDLDEWLQQNRRRSMSDAGK